MKHHKEVKSKPKAAHHGAHIKHMEKAHNELGKAIEKAKTHHEKKSESSKKKEHKKK